MMLLFLLHCFEKVCQARLYGKGCVKKTMTDETKVVSNRGSIGWIGSVVRFSLRSGLVVALVDVSHGYDYGVGTGREYVGT